MHLTGAMTLPQPHKTQPKWIGSVAPYLARITIRRESALLPHSVQLIDIRLYRRGLYYLASGQAVFSGCGIAFARRPNHSFQGTVDLSNAIVASRLEDNWPSLSQQFVCRAVG